MLPGRVFDNTDMDGDKMAPRLLGLISKYGVYMANLSIAKINSKKTN